jgi:hypothetical protein
MGLFTCQIVFKDGWDHCLEPVLLTENIDFVLEVNVYVQSTVYARFEISNFSSSYVLKRKF